MSDKSVSESKSEPRVAWLDRPSVSLYKSADSVLGRILKAVGPPSPRSNQDEGSFADSTKLWPFDMAAVKKFLDFNEHHSTCILTKARATVGLGFKTPSEIKKEKADKGMEPVEPSATDANEKSKVDEVLDSYCRTTFKDVLDSSTEDYHNIGNGYIEVVRDVGGAITGLFFLPGEQVWLKQLKGQIFYEVRPTEGGVSQFFAPFGQREAVAALLSKRAADEVTRISEVIHFPKASSRSRWYGYPDWLSTTASLELVQMIIQNHFDFHMNRGVPEFFALFLGAKIDEDDWKAIKESMRAHIGLGKSHKSLAMNLPDPNLEVQIEKLALDGKEQDSFSDQQEALALKIVTAHRVPPLLAGIQIPGKLGATNELPNALLGFQALVIGPAQVSILAILKKTLGDSALSGLGLSPDDFVLRKITEVIDVDKADTVSRMRQTVPEAQAEGRDLNQGLKKALDSIPEEERAAVVSSAVADVLMRLSA